MANGVRFDGTQYGWVDNYIASDPGALTVTFVPDIVSGPVVVSGIYTRHLSLLVEYNDEGQCQVVAGQRARPDRSRMIRAGLPAPGSPRATSGMGPCRGLRFRGETPARL